MAATTDKAKIKEAVKRRKKEVYTPVVPDMQLGFVHNNVDCIGCRACEIACKDKKQADNDTNRVCRKRVPTLWNPITQFPDTSNTSLIFHHATFATGISKPAENGKTILFTVPIHRIQIFKTIQKIQSIADPIDI